MSKPPCTRFDCLLVAERLDQRAAWPHVVVVCRSWKVGPVFWLRHAYSSCGWRYLHGFICRPDAASDLLRRLSDAVEAFGFLPFAGRIVQPHCTLRKDAEFSVRHFAKDQNSIHASAEQNRRQQLLVEVCASSSAWANFPVVQDGVVLRYRMYAGLPFVQFLEKVVSECEEAIATSS